MNLIFRRLIKALALLAVLSAITFASFLGYSTIKRYRPGSIEQAAVLNVSRRDTIPADTLRLVTWNIGYCGLGKEMDFFYEGGKMVRPDEDPYHKYISGVVSQVSRFAAPDFIFIQEVDRNSKRSYHEDQAIKISEQYPGYESDFAVNYNSVFVPVPPLEPMGSVLGGIMTLGKYAPREATRHAFSSSYGWPKQLFMLERCFLLTRYPVAGGKHLVLINTHNSAFDDAADMRAGELALLKSTMEKEYQEGNYVIVGGDWNQNPVPYDSTKVTDGNIAKCIHPGIPADFLSPGWHWDYDPSKASNRDVDRPYEKGINRTTIIDFFVTSPNVAVVTVKVIQTGFLFSDHQPVRMEAILRR